MSIAFLPEEEQVSTDEYLPGPLEDVGVVQDLVLDQLLGHREQHLAPYYTMNHSFIISDVIKCYSTALDTNNTCI